MTAALAGLALALLNQTAGAGGMPDPAWQEVSTDHFIVVFTDAAEAARRIGSVAEDWYARLVAELGLPRRGESWQWERRIRIRLYPSAEAFRTATRAPEWAVGRASMREREIATWIGAGDFTNSVLPHELTHLVLRSYLGPEREAPLWFVEGLTQWAEPAKRASALVRDRSLGDVGRIPLELLMRLRVEALANAVEAGRFYRQSLSLVAFLLERAGSERFGELCRRLRDGRDFADALRFTYPEMRSTKDLERLWLEWLATGS